MLGYSLAHLDHTLSESVEFGGEMHAGGVLASRWPRHFTVVGVGIAAHALLFTVVNDEYAIIRGNVIALLKIS